MASQDRTAAGEASPSGLAQRYASALYDVARDTGVVEAIDRDLQMLAGLVATSPDLARLTRSPLFTRKDQGRAMAAVLDRAGVHPLTRKFVLFLAAQRRLFALTDIARAFARMVAKARGEMSASVASARPLKEAQLAALRAQLKAAFGRDVALAAQVDPSLLGGLVVRVGSRMIDSSLKTKLASLAQVMKGA